VGARVLERVESTVKVKIFILTDLEAGVRKRDRGLRLIVVDVIYIKCNNNSGPEWENTSTIFYPLPLSSF